MTRAGRTLAATLAMAAVGFAAYVDHEGYAPVAKPPVPGDVPTYGFGSTRGPDGQPLKGGEKITRAEAIELAKRDVTVHEREFRRCLDGVRLYQHEYDALMSLALNVGAAVVCRSSIPAKLRAGDYAAACATFLEFNKFCSRPRMLVAGKRVCPPGALKPLPGLTKRRQQEYRMCMGENHAE
jgi:lysozyme